MPKLWDATIEVHRSAVRDATLDTAATLVARHGLRSVTMSQIALEAGIGRATLYKYFPDVESILAAWHERQVSGHLHHLAQLRANGGTAGERLSQVLEAYALMQQAVATAHGSEMLALLHGGAHVQQARHQLSDFVQELLTEGAAAGELRNDVAPDELTAYCLHALAAAAVLPSAEGVRRLVGVTLAGLRPPPGG